MFLTNASFRLRKRKNTIIIFMENATSRMKKKIYELIMSQNIGNVLEINDEKKKRKRTINKK